jgi:hypothetical protein
MDQKQALDQMNLSPAEREFFELMMKEEDLHPDLVPYLENRPQLGTVLKHPLIFEIFYSPHQNARINKQYLHKLEYTNEKLKEGNYSSYIWMFERPHRLEKFMEIQDSLSDEQYWDLLGSIWSDSENLWQYGSSLGWLMTAERAHREKFMDDEEREFLNNLPEYFTIYRGHQGSRNRMGWSWSLSYFKARWFAQRFDQRGAAVIRANVKKEDVIGYLDGRNEYEIVVDPDFVTNVKTVKPAKRPDWLQPILEDAWAGFSLGRKNSVHGLWHWEKVERNALALAKATPDADKIVCQIFALVHDSKRQNEDDDPEHGDRAAEFVEKLYKEEKLPITVVQKELLTYACRLHEKGQVSDNPTIGVCWDADRLDLTRVGITPDPKLLSTKAGVDLMWQI